MKLSILILFLCTSFISVAYNETQEGYAIIRSDTIYGQIKIHFETGSITIKQDSINRMYLSGIERVILFNKQRETFIFYQIDQRSTFLKVLVDGSYPLLELSSEHYTLIQNQLIRLENEKSLFKLFGKKETKDYLFLRNISLDNDGMIDVFRHFNKYGSL